MMWNGGRSPGIGMKETGKEGKRKRTREGRKRKKEGSRKGKEN